MLISIDYSFHDINTCDTTVRWQKKLSLGSVVYKLYAFLVDCWVFVGSCSRESFRVFLESSSHWQHAHPRLPKIL